MWIVAIACGSITLTLLWFFERTQDLTVSTWALKMLPVLVVCELFYWYGFRKAPSFIAARYTMSAMMHGLGWGLAVCLLGESVTLNAILGAGLIVAGSIVLGMK